MKRPTYWNHNTAYYPWIARQLTDKKCVLDVGCGDGALAEYLGDCKEVVGLDPAAECICRAKQRNRGTFHCCAFEDFSAEDCAFDAIIFAASLHHMEADAAIKKAKRLLHPGGVLVVVGLATPSTLWERLIEIFRVLPSWVSSRLHRMQSAETLNIPTNYTFPTMEEVRSLMRRELPGSVLRQGLHYRYLLRWTK